MLGELFMITTLYLIRHAQSIGNEKKLFGGITDYELSELGLKQADSLAIKLQDYKIDKIYSSPLRRTIQTITPTAESKHLKINIEENLKELNCGSWENRLRSELYDLYPEIINYIDETGNFRGMQGQEEMISDSVDRIQQKVDNAVKDGTITKDMYDELEKQLKLKRFNKELELREQDNLVNQFKSSYTGENIDDNSEYKALIAHRTQLKKELDGINEDIANTSRLGANVDIDKLMYKYDSLAEAQEKAERSLSNAQQKGTDNIFKAIQQLKNQKKLLKRRSSYSVQKIIQMDPSHLKLLKARFKVLNQRLIV